MISEIQIPSLNFTKLLNLELVSDFSLIGKKILVFGATGGIGQGICKVLIEGGAEIILGGRDLEKINLLNTELNTENTPFVLNDLSENSISDCVSNLDELDGFIYAAGINLLSTIKSLNIQKFRDTLEINTILPALITKNLVKYKKLLPGSSIVFISSIAGIHRSSFGNSTYSASKAALDGFMKNAALELASMKIRVNNINPAMIRTPLLGKNGLSDVEYNKDEQNYPLGRYGTPKDVANCALFLLSDASNWITGQSIILDGGVTLR
jgi:NAD(P)-dependent dehydrogenase (short-subunit alcohol dehydrogenase family)